MRACVLAAHAITSRDIENLMSAHPEGEKMGKINRKRKVREFMKEQFAIDAPLGPHPHHTVSLYAVADPCANGKRKYEKVDGPVSKRHQDVYMGFEIV